MNISAITSFDKNLERLSMNSRNEGAKLESEPTFKETINEIKDNGLKGITYIEMNVSAITSIKPSLSSEHLKSNLIPCILLQSPVKSPQFINNLSSINPKGNTQLQI